MLSEAFISQQRNRLLNLQQYYQVQSIKNGSIENLSDKKDTLAQIRSALEAIQNGDYGYCEDCDELILIRRLNMIPQATRCAPCQELFEKNNVSARKFHMLQHERIIR